MCIYIYTHIWAFPKLYLFFVGGWPSLYIQGLSQKRCLFGGQGGPHNKDYRVLRVYIGVPLFRETIIYMYIYICIYIHGICIGLKVLLQEPIGARFILYPKGPST